MKTRVGPGYTARRGNPLGLPRMAFGWRALRTRATR